MSSVFKTSAAWIRLPLCILSVFSLNRIFQSPLASTQPCERKCRMRVISVFFEILRSPMLPTFENGTITVMLV